MTEVADRTIVRIEGERRETVAVASARDITELTIVVPTRNEAGNIAPLVTLLQDALSRFAVEVLFVDDSDDDTAERIAAIAAENALDDFSIRLIARAPGQRDGGLSGAVLAGLAAASHRWVCVMDGDLQHPPSVVEQMAEVAMSTRATMIIASRYVDDGSNEGLAKRSRRAVSAFSTRTARSMFGTRLARLSDPMSGFFLLDSARLDLRRLRPRGFKILLEIVISHPGMQIAEVPFHFGERGYGESKASLGQGVEFARQLIDLKMSGAKRAVWSYDIHGIIGVESDGALPELEKFVARACPEGAPRIIVRIADLSAMPLGESLDVTGERPVVGYRERAGFAMCLDLGVVDTNVTVSPFVAKSPHVMYTNVVEPILRWRLVEFGYSLVHAACFSDGAEAYLVTARTDTGKTTTMLKVLDQSELSFISDDLIIMDRSGMVRTFPKPLTISKHTVHALRNTSLTRSQRLALIPQSRIHSREGRLFAFLLTKYRLPVASINAMMQRAVPPPKYHVEKLVRGVTSHVAAEACGMFIIQRGGTGDEQIPTAEALEILLENCDDAFGFPPYATLERLLLSSASDDLRAKEREIINMALSKLPALVMRSDTLDWAERIPEAVSQWRESRITPEVRI